jgi:MFS family permease
MENPAKSKRHWLVLAGCCGMSASSLGVNVNTIGVFYTPVAEALGVFRGDFAMHSTIAALTMAFMALYIPRILAIHRFKPVLIIGVIAASLSTIGMAFTTRMWVFYLLGAIRGLGSGVFALVPVTTLLNNWFEEKNGMAMSIAFGFAGVGGAFMSPLFTSLIQNVGWEIAFIVMGVLMGLMCVPGILYASTLDPTEEGYLPYGAKTEQEKEAATDATALKRKLENQPVSYKGMAFISLLVVALLHSSIVGVVQHLPGLAESIQLSTNVGALMLSASMIGNIVFKLLIGILSDTLGAVKSALIMIAINFASLLMLSFLHAPTPMILAGFLFGTVYTIPPVGLPLLTNAFFGRVRAMRVYPILSFSSGVGTAMAMSLVGYIYDFTGSYQSALWISIAFHIVNVTLLFIGVKATDTDLAT